MKILHTADWHIGRRLNGTDLLSDQMHVLDQLIEYIKNEEIDLCVIAGDVFDRSNPSQAALELVNEYLYRINIGLGVPVLAISGNHDSRSRLGYGSRWFETRIYNILKYIGVIPDTIINDDLHVYMVPYMDVLEVMQYFKDESIISHHDVYSNVTGEIRKRIVHDARNIFVGHMFISDAK